MTERERLEQAINHMETQRPVLGDAVVDAAIAPMQEKLDKLGAADSHSQRRKLVTVLFMDVVGSTEIISALDPEENFEVMSGALEHLSIPIEQYKGNFLSSKV